jgi:hypothetical protein
MKLPNFTPKSIMIGLSLLAFFLRAYRLEAQSYWIDEAWSLFYANLSLAELWHALQTIRAAPPLYHVLTIYWVKLVGDGEYALRFLSLLFSVMAVPLTYRLGKTLGGGRLGLMAALLMTVAPYQIWHAQDARNYSMLTAAATMSMWSFFNVWQRGGWRWRLIYILSTLCAVFTHYHGLVIIGIQGLFFLIAWRRYWRNYLSWAGILLLILIPLIAWLIFGSRLWQSDHWLPQVGLWDSYIRNAVAYSVGELIPRPQAIFLTLIFVSFYGIGLIYAAYRQWRILNGWEMLAFLLAYTLAPNIAVWLYSQFGTSVYLERYLISVQIGYLLAIALGVLAIFDMAGGFARLGSVISGRCFSVPAPVRRFLPYILGSAVIMILVSLSGWVLSRHYYDPVFAKPNWRGVIRMIEAFSQPGDAILLTGDGGEKLFDYYYRGDLPVYYNFNTPAPPPAEARRRIADITARYRRLWYTPYGVAIDAVLEPWLAEHSYPAWQSWLGRKRLALYQTQAAIQRQETVGALFPDPSGQGPRLIEAGLPNTSIAAGDLLPLSLTWQTETPLPHDYQLSLRLVNRRGDIFAQSDWPPLAANNPTSSWSPRQAISDRRSLWVPPDIPPGAYLLQLVVYEPTSGQALGQPVTLPDIAISPANIIPPLEALSIPNLIQNPEPPQPVPNTLTERQSPQPNIQYPISNIQYPRLVGYVLPEEIQPGQELWLWLYWQAQGWLAPDIGLQLSLHSGNETVAFGDPLADSVGPLDSWRPGQVRRAVYHLPTSPRLAGESAEVRLILKAGSDTLVDIPVAHVKLLTRARQFELPAMTQPVNVVFSAPSASGNATLLKLLSYDLPTDTLLPGDKLPLTLYWQAEAEMEVDHTVFVQLLNSAGRVVAQVDVPPLAGAAPTTTWLPGEVLTDPYTLALPADLIPGEYRLITGLYDAATGQRLAVASGGDFVELGKITIE